MPRRRKRGQRKRKTPKIGMTSTTKDDTDCVDRISNLPIEIIHRIHLCLPRGDAARTSVLSHRWRTIWASYPFIHLDEQEFGTKYSNRDEEKKKAFLAYLKKSLDKCEHVDSLFLRMTVENDGFKELLIKKWIDYAFKNKVKSLHISLKTTYGTPFDLSNIAFVAATLVELKINHCQISTNCCFMLPALRSLFLINVCIDDDDDFKNLLAGCLRIEKLRIISCYGMLGNMVVSNPTLKLFGLSFPSFVAKVQIESKNLESLEFSFFNLWQIEITCSTTVRNLTLRGVNDRTLMHFINQFPLLEKLMIYSCYNLQNLYVSQRNLASFVLHLDDEVEEVIIDAPKLKSFKYKGGLTSFLGIEASRELECVRFDLNPERHNDRWYIWLRNILESFAHSKHLSLICDSKQAIIFPDELTEMLLPTINDLKHLELRIDSSTATSREILDGFVWILPGLKTLSLTSGSVTKFIKFLQ